jgi:hypothetical protein
MRKGAMPFITEYVSVEARTAHDEMVAAESSSFVDEVLEVFRQHAGSDLDVDQVWKILQENGSQQDRDRVRNSINYALRLEKIRRAARRGVYTLRDTSTPAGTGAEVKEESVNGSSGEIGGGRDEASTPPHDQGGGADIAPNHLDRVGDRAPIGGD